MTDYEWITTDPTNPDTDGDGLPDGWERQHGFHPADPSDGLADYDQDGLRNGEEFALGTSFWNPDTDGDGWTDFEEWLLGTNPLDPLDPPNPPDEEDSGSGEGNPDHSGSGGEGGSRGGGDGSGGGGDGSGGGGDGSGGDGDGSGGNSGGSQAGGGDGALPIPAPHRAELSLRQRTASLWGGPAGSEYAYRGGTGDEEYEGLLAQGWESDYYHSEDVLVGTIDDEDGNPVEYIYEQQSSWTVRRLNTESTEDLDFVAEDPDGNVSVLVPKEEFGTQDRYHGSADLLIFAPAPVGSGSAAPAGGAAAWAEMIGAPFPQGSWRQLWVEASEPAPEAIAKTWLVVSQTSAPGQATSSSHGFATFTIPKGGTRSVSVALAGSPGAVAANGGYLTLAPQRPADGAIRSVSLEPIRLLQVNDSDTDGDGVPDFADGIAGLLPGHGRVPVDLDGTREAECRDLDSLPLSFLGYPASTVVKFHYDHSNPFQAVYRSDPAPDQPAYEPAAGALRLWNRNPAQPVDGEIAPRTSSDLLLPGQAVPVVDLARGIFVESVRASQTEGDQVVRVDIDRKDGSMPETRIFAFTSVGVTRLAILPDGTLTRHAPDLQTYSNPSIDLSIPQVSNIRYDADADAILGDITVGGKVRSDLCDLTPGPGGIISAAYLQVNSAPSSEGEISLAVSKTFQPGSRARPFPYAGTFHRTLSGVPLEIGENVIEALAVDPLTGFAGGGRVRFTVEASLPAGPGGTGNEVVIEFPDADPALAPGTLRVTATSADGGSLAEILQEDPLDPARYANASEGTVIEFASVPALDPGIVESIDASVRCQAIGWSYFVGFSLSETGPGTAIFSAASQLSGLGDADPEDWVLQLAGVEPAESDGQGDLVPFRLRLDGPESLLKTVDLVRPAEAEGAGAVSAAKDSVDGRYYAAGPAEPGAPKEEYVPFAFVRMVADSGGDGNGVADVADLLARVKAVDAFLAPPNFSDHAKFTWGMARGTWHWGRDTVRDTAGLVKFAGHRLTVQGWIWEFTAGDSFQGEMAAIRHAAERAEFYGPMIDDFLRRVQEAEQASDEELLAALLTGDLKALGAVHGPEYWMVVDALAAILIAGGDGLAGLTWEERGVVVGYLLPEVALIAGATGVGALAANGAGAAAGLVAKGGHSLYRLVAVLKRLQSSPRLAGLLGDLRFLDKIADQLEHALLWSKMDSLADSAKVFKILEFHRLVNPPGTTAWEVFEKAAPKLKSRGLWRQDLQHGALDGTLRRMFDGYEGGSIPREKIPDGDALRALMGDLGEQWADDFILRRYRPELARIEGRVGEQAAALIGKPKVGVDMPSGNKRFPDHWDDQGMRLIEVKNRKELGLSAQMRDYIDYCIANNYAFELWIRGGNPGTHLTGPLQQRLAELGQLGLYHGPKYLNP